MGKFINLTSKRFGRWFVIEQGPNIGRHVQWLCRCDCGKEGLASSTNLVQGKSTSCGCYQVDVVSTHGDYKSSEYSTYQTMKSRCFRPNTTGYAYYGGRGITVCGRWKESYLNFISDMGRKPTPKHSLDRINPDGNYCPENCRWAVMEVQNNNRRDNHHITYQGKTQTIAQWARDMKLLKGCLVYRINAGWPITEAMLTPPGEH